MKPSKKLLRGIFLTNIIMLLVLIFAAVTDYLKFQNSKSWVESECQIISSEVRDTNANTKTKLYTPSIYYTYQVNGNIYKSGQYSLFEMHTNDYKANKAIVDSYVPGKKYPCFYNPNIPEDAALDIKSYKKSVLLLAFIGSLFVIGLIINAIIYTSFGYHRKQVVG